jgi:hypothetical protein
MPFQTICATSGDVTDNRLERVRHAFHDVGPQVGHGRPSVHRHLHRIHFLGIRQVGVDLDQADAFLDRGNLFLQILGTNCINPEIY